VVVESDFYQGISYIINPNQTELFNDTAYDFTFILDSDYWTVTDFGFVLFNSTGDNIGSDSDTTNGGTTTVNLDVGNNIQISINYYWVIDSNYTNGSRMWYVMNDAGTDWSIWVFFRDLRNYADDEIFGLDNFGLAILTFLFIFIFTGIMSYKFGLISPAAISMLIFTLVLFFDVGLGLMEGFNPIGALPHLPTILVGIIMAGILFKEVYR
ncbi:unnamed protein product, partial [marine sediment metagenome]